MTGSKPTEEDDDDWSPKEDPAPARPWGRLLNPGDLPAGIAAVTPFTVEESALLRDAIVKVALGKFHVGAGTKRRVHVSVPNAQPFDVVVSLPASRRVIARGGIGKVLPRGTTFKLVRASSTRIRPSTAQKVRRSDAVSTGDSVELELKDSRGAVKVNVASNSGPLYRLRGAVAGRRSAGD